MVRMTALTRTVLATALVFTTLPAAARDEGSLRVATFNTYLLSNKFRCIQFRKEASTVFGPEIDILGKVDCAVGNTSLPFIWTSEQIAAQANAIADEILSLGDKVDVIALNEVWDEAAKDILIKRLKGKFPNQVRRIDGSFVISDPVLLKMISNDSPAIPFKGEDSGLMLFARRDVKFIPFAAPAGSSGLTTTEVEATSPNVRAHTFIAASGADGLAAKAVGAVRAEYSLGGQRARAYILFTHMQADADQSTSRMNQFREMRRFIRNSVIDRKASVADEMSKVMIVGDLNVQGEGEIFPVPPSKTPKVEWQDRFTKGLPGPVLGDTWARENSDKYIGATYAYTNPADSQRLDYLLMQEGTDTLGYCVQHSQVLLKDSPSDHSALVSDVNRRFAFCNPRIAALPPMGTSYNPSVGSVSDATQIAQPGSMQWFRFPGRTAATVDVSIGSVGPVQPRMFAADDLSREVAPVEKKARTSTWSVPSDFFVQTRASGRTFAGDYTINFDRRLCLSSDAPCYLTPTRLQKARFPAGSLLGAEDTAFFRMDVTEAADSGAPQSVEVNLRNVPKSYSVVLVNADNPAEVIDTETVGGDTMLTSQLKFQLTGTKKLLLKIARDNDKNTARTIRADWTNNLTQASIRTLVCFDETDGLWGNEAGEDEIAMFVEYDGMSRRVPQSGYRDFDCNSTDMKDNFFAQTLRSIGPIRVRIFEQDDGSANDGSVALEIAPIKKELEKMGQALRWQPFEEGDYGMFYNVRMGSSGLPSP